MPRGRNKEFILLRNEALLRRYLYWTEIQRRRFDDVLLILSRYEFFISERTILSVVNSNDERLGQLRLEMKGNKKGAYQVDAMTTPPKQLSFFTEQEQRIGL